VGEIRFAVDPTYRRKGLGAHLIEELILYAIEQGLEKPLAEALAAERALERFGFKRLGAIPGLVKDNTGTYRDLRILVLNLGTAFLPDWYYF
jgi:GNAT superfamily N-acetyltransferase